MIISLFETPIHIIQCDLDIECLYENILQFRSRVQTSYRSNSGGYQGHHFENCDLENCIKENIPQRIDKPLLDFKLESWVNINGRGHWNDVHSHCDDGVMLSGIFYVNCPENSGNIRFYDCRSNTSKSYNRYYEEHQGNYLSVKPQNNLMLFFPPWLMHLVEPNQSDGERVSVSFNILNPVF